MHLKKIVQGTTNGIKILVGYGSKRLFFFFFLTQEPMVYLNFNAIFEFLGQFTIRSIYHFSERCW